MQTTEPEPLLPKLKSHLCQIEQEDIPQYGKLALYKHEKREITRRVTLTNGTEISFPKSLIDDFQKAQKNKHHKPEILWPVTLTSGTKILFPDSLMSDLKKAQADQRSSEVRHALAKILG